MLLSEAVLTNQNVSLFILKWCRKQKSAFPAVRAIFRLHWREREKRRETTRMHAILHFRFAGRVRRREMERGGEGKTLMWNRGAGSKAEKMETKKKRWERKKARRRDSHTWFASSLGISSGLQGENYCTSPPRARVTSLTTLINWKSVIAQTVLLSAC